MPDAGDCGSGRPTRRGGAVAAKITVADLEDLCRGAAVLGTGGGGDPYVGRLVAAQAMRGIGAVELLDLDELDDEALVIAVGNMGAPTILIEKLPNGDEPVWALEALEARLGRRASAIIPFEAGGSNATIPFLVGAKRGLPVVDGDGMGRAFPELQMETFNVYGVSASPVALADPHHNRVLIEAHSAQQAEWLARGVAIRMGGRASLADYAMDGATAKRVSVPATLSLCLKLGRVIRFARERHTDPFAALIAALADTHYSHGRTLFAGKIVDLARVTTRGFAIGHALIEGTGAWPGRMTITFQNENLIATHQGEVRAIVPDLICILDADTAEPITTERLRYGQRVRAMGISAPPIMRTPEALAVFGPRAFGLDEPFRPLEDIPETSAG